MTYGYVRVSTTQQKIDRQYEEMVKQGVPPKNLFIDKQSGKDFNRTNYQRMLRKIKKGDLVILKSIDRLGRNYQMIIEEWSRITKKIGADILVIDMPLLDTRAGERNLMGTFISDLVLQILSFVAENERTAIRERQAEGIRIAKEKGVVFGRPKKPITEQARQVFCSYLHRESSLEECLTQLNISKGTFYRQLKKHNEEFGSIS